MPVLDAKFIRKEERSVTSTVYMKKTHSDQYLNVASNHPKHQKLRVVSALMNWCETTITEDGDKNEAMKHLRAALRFCGYPSRVLKKIPDNEKCREKTNSRIKNKDYKSKVVIPYVEGVSGNE